MLNCLSIYEKVNLKGGENLKKEWKKPEIETLDINMTMLGANNGGVDFYVKDPFDGEEATFHS